MIEQEIEKQNNSAVFIFGMCPLIPATANFAYGLIMAVAVWIIFFSGILANLVAEMLEIKKLKSIFVNLFIISLATIFNFLIESIFPIIHGGIKIYIYILCFSYIMFLSFKNYYKDGGDLELPASYSIIILILSSIREFFAFGTISFPVPSGFFTINFPYFSENTPFRFFGTTAAAFIILGLGMWIYHSIQEGSSIPFREEH